MDGARPGLAGLPRRSVLSAGGLGIATMALPTSAAATSVVTPTLAGGEDLLLYLDVGQTSSYPGTGTTWTDLSGNARHATLVGAVTHTDAGTGSYLVFDGTGAKTETGPHAVAPALPDLTSWTISTWARLTDGLTSRTAAIVTDVFDGTSTVNFTLGSGRPGTSTNLTSGFYTASGGGWLSSSGVDAAEYVDAWHHHAATYDGTTLRQYVDGVEVGTAASPGVTTTSGGVGVRIARRWDSFQEDAGFSNYYAVDVGMVRIVGRALTSTELTEDYVATLGRYGLS